MHKPDRLFFTYLSIIDIVMLSLWHTYLVSIQTKMAVHLKLMGTNGYLNTVQLHPLGTWYMVYMPTF